MFCSVGKASVSCVLNCSTYDVITYFFFRFVKGSKPGYKTGFDIDEVDLMDLERPHEIIVASAIFGTYN